MRKFSPLFPGVIAQTALLGVGECGHRGAAFGSGIVPTCVRPKGHEGITKHLHDIPKEHRNA